MRNRLPPSADSSENNSEDSPFIFKVPKDHNMPTAQELLALHPAKSGFCLKENNSIWASICCCYAPKLKSRFFILVGNFLFRFKDEHGEKPKGVPIPLDSASVRAIDGETFEVSTIRKVYTIRTEATNEAFAWVKAISERKAQAIKERMGHATTSKEVNQVNRRAHLMFEKRVQQDKEDGNAVVSNPMGMYSGQQ